MNRRLLTGCALALAAFAGPALAWDNYYLPAPTPGAQRAVVRYHRGPFGGVHYKNKYHMGHHGGVVEGGGGGLFNGNFWTHAGNAVTLAGTVLDLFDSEEAADENRAAEARSAQFRSAIADEDAKLSDALALYNRIDRLAVAFELPAKPIGNMDGEVGVDAPAASGSWANYPPGNVNPSGQGGAGAAAGQGPGNGGNWKNFPPGNE